MRQGIPTPPPEALLTALINDLVSVPFPFILVLDNEHWSAWFAGLKIAHTDQDETVLSGAVVDQAALYGVLSMLRDLGLPLLSVTGEESDSAAENDC